MGKITAINVKIPKQVSLPDGIYAGTWGGSIIEIFYDKVWYELTTQEGVRGIGYKVVVTIKDQIATFEILNN